MSWALIINFSHLAEMGLKSIHELTTTEGSKNAAAIVISDRSEKSNLSKQGQQLITRTY